MDLHNTYFLIRHGQSHANVQDLIVSRLEDGLDPKYGLTDVGRRQADEAGEKLLHSLGAFNPERFVVYTSPFSRAIETAARAGVHLGVSLKDLNKASELRERFFGEHDMTNTAHYHTVWADDAADPAHKPPGDGESVVEVAERLKAFIQKLERMHLRHDILIVSHGDALSILASVMLGTDLKEHRKNYPLANAGMLRVAALRRSSPASLPQ